MMLVSDGIIVTIASSRRSLSHRADLLLAQAFSFEAGNFCPSDRPIWPF